MQRKNWVYLKRGLVQDPKHRENMGNRIWLYMHILDRADWEAGMVRQWKDKNEADEIEMEVRTLRAQRQELEERGYITCIRKGNHQQIIIHNWTNPRNYSGEIHNLKSDKKMSLSDQQSNIESNIESSIEDDTPSIRVKNHKSLISKRAEHAPDPRSKHPAILAIQAITGRYPSKNIYDAIIRIVGETPNCEDLKTCFEAWCLKGFRPTNFGWVTDWYITGIPTHEPFKKSTEPNGHGAMARAISKMESEHGDH